MSFLKDIKALYRQSLLSTRDSDEILLDLKAELTNHNNLSMILEELSSHTYREKKQKVMRLVFERVESGENIEDIFLFHGIIEKDEYLLLKRALSTSSGIEAVITFRKEGSQFFEFFRKIFLPAMLFVFFGLASLLFTVPLLKNFLNTEVAPLVSMKKNFTVEFDLPIFMKEEIYLYMTIGVYMLIIGIVWSIFAHYKKTNIGKLYKMSNIMFYDDFIKYFTIASSMKKSGASSDQIFEDLSFQAAEGLQSTFNDMFIRGSDFYESLELLNAPYRIVSVMRRNEENSTFWTHLDATIDYVKGLRNDKVDFYVKYFSKAAFLLGFIFLMGSVALPIVYFILNIYAFAL